MIRINRIKWSELNKSANHLAKNSDKKNTQEKVNKDCRNLVVLLISCNKNFILPLACFDSIFTRFFKIYIFIIFLSLSRPLFPASLEGNPVLGQESLLIFHILTHAMAKNDSISE